MSCLLARGHLGPYTTSNLVHGRSLSTCFPSWSNLDRTSSCGQLALGPICWWCKVTLHDVLKAIVDLPSTQWIAYDVPRLVHGVKAPLYRLGSGCIPGLGPKPGSASISGSHGPEYRVTRLNLSFVYVTVLFISLHWTTSDCANMFNIS